MSDYGMNCCALTGSTFAEKDPDDTLDFAFNWAPWLDGDRIVASEFSLPDGLTEEGSSFAIAATQITVSGGSPCCSYRITNRITTDAGRVKDKTIWIGVRAF